MATKITGLDEHTKRRKKAQAVIVALVDAAGADGLLRTNLYKAFWLSHLFAMTETGRSLTDWPIVKMPRGPGIHEFTDLISDLVGSVLQDDEETVGPLPRPTDACSRSRARAEAISELRSDELVAVKHAVKLVGSRSANDASRLSHEVSRSWREAQKGAELDIYLDLLVDDEEVDRIRESTAKNAELARKILGC
jgi:hypothetical protein